MLAKIQMVLTPQWKARFLPEHGGHLVQLQHRPTGLELLHFPESEAEYQVQPERFGVPILFPPNRIENGVFSWKGTEYSLPINDIFQKSHIHGIVRKLPWSFDIAGDNSGEAEHVSVTLSVLHDASRETFAGYPHRFRLTTTWRFSPEGVTQENLLENLDEAGTPPLPFALGFHTAFRLPPVETSSAHLTIRGEDFCWEVDRTNGLCHGKQKPWPEGLRYHKEGGQRVDTSRLISHHFPATTVELEGQPFRGALLDFPGLGQRIRYEMDEAFTQWFIWQPKDDLRVLCIEPMTCIANAPNLDLPPETTGWRDLAPGQSWSAQTRLSLEALA